MNTSFNKITLGSKGLTYLQQIVELITETLLWKFYLTFTLSRIVILVCVKKIGGFVPYTYRGQNKEL